MSIFSTIRTTTSILALSVLTLATFSTNFSSVSAEALSSPVYSGYTYTPVSINCGNDDVSYGEGCGINPLGKISWVVLIKIMVTVIQFWD